MLQNDIEKPALNPEFWTIWKARTQSPWFFYLRLVCAFKSAGSADLLSFGSVGVGCASDLLCWLPAYDRAKMQPVYLLKVGLTDILSIFVWSKCCTILYVDFKKCK